MLRLVCGTRLSGKVDQVRGAFSVQTRFAHLARLPLLPIESWLVLDSGDGQAWRGVKLRRLSIRSISFAWGRVALAALGIWAGATAFAALGTDDMVGLAGGSALAAVSIAAFVYSYRFSCSSYQEAIELVRRLRLGEQYEMIVGECFERAVVPEEG
jgi:hypothetical protein